MGGLFGGGSSTTNNSTTTTTTNAIGPYPDDGAKRAPVSNSRTVLEAAAKKRREITSRSGRTSTRLAANAGTAPYVNSFLGSVQ